MFQIHQMMLDDPDLLEAIQNAIWGQSLSAESAAEQAGQNFAAAFAAMENPYMQARAADVLDITARMARLLGGAAESEFPGDSPCILAADDLAPSETARLQAGQVLAFATSGGSANSHTAIFARTMGIPAVAGLGPALLQLPDGVEVAVNGEEGTLLVNPDAPARLALEERRQQAESLRQRREAFRGKETRSRSGQKVLLCANIGSPADLKLALAGDAEGIGLFRSEFLYLQQNALPSEETQLEAYRAALEAMGNRQVIIRTLDIGADKQAAYLGLPAEENPALGLRAVRLCLSRPEIFITQLRALYRASPQGNLAVMFPMITSLDELRQCRTLAAKAREELRAEGLPFREDVPLGIMIETPAAALLSGELAREADFFSVGTNDLTQYTLALDRQNSALTRFADPANKAILRLVAMAAESAQAAGIWIGICGELGADERFTKTFLSLGIDELSVAPSAILPLREKIAQLD